MSTINTKTCDACGKEQPLSMFKRSNKTLDGYSKCCRDCLCQRAENKRNNTEHKTTSHEGVIPLIRGGADSPLRDFTPRQLIEELRARGFHGDLTCNVTVKV